MLKHLKKYFKSLDKREIFIIFLVFLVIILFATTAYYQKKNSISIIVRPFKGEKINPSLIEVTTNRILTEPGEKKYDIEISEDKNFQNIQGQCKNMTNDRCKFHFKFKSNTKYYIRTRTIIDNNINPWSKTTFFYTTKNYPLVFLEGFE